MDIKQKKNFPIFPFPKSTQSLININSNTLSSQISDFPFQNLSLKPKIFYDKQHHSIFINTSVKSVPSIKHKMLHQKSFFNSKKTSPTFYIPKQPFPTPKGSSPYCLAKKCQFQDRDFDRAQKFYQLAIKQKDRLCSAVKDYATLLHQKGKTQQGLKLLLKYKSVCSKDLKSYQNLYQTLDKQLQNSSNGTTKSLKLFPLKPEHTQNYVFSLFSNPVRILSINLQSQSHSRGQFAIINFSSHSSAKKTLETFNSWDIFSIYWISDTGDIKGDAHYARNKMAEYRKHHPTYEYKIFMRETTGYVLSIPIDGQGLYEDSDQVSDQEGKEFLGSIYHDINQKILNQVICISLNISSRSS